MNKRRFQKYQPVGLSMEEMKSSHWQYSPNNSPQPLPKSPFVCTNTDLLPLDFNLTMGEDIQIEDLKQKVIQARVGNSSLEDFMRLNSAPEMGDRMPILLLGELANPFQLSRLKLGIIPVICVRINGLSRTYADSLDDRMVRPGIHHVTLARTPGWWEVTHLAFATLPQMKAMVTWLNNGKRGNWRGVKANEGSIRVENQSQLRHPTAQLISWDGKTEICTDEEPEVNGPSFDISDVMIPIHTNYGCYDSRGKIIRCVHVGQREFHHNYFRRGSSKRWQDILDVV